MLFLIWYKALNDNHYSEKSSFEVEAANRDEAENLAYDVLDDAGYSDIDIREVIEIPPIASEDKSR